jgi:hypothetical protein
MWVIPSFEKLVFLYFADYCILVDRSTRIFLGLLERLTLSLHNCRCGYLEILIGANLNFVKRIKITYHNTH